MDFFSTPVLPTASDNQIRYDGPDPDQYHDPEAVAMVAGGTLANRIGRRYGMGATIIPRHVDGVNAQFTHDPETKLVCIDPDLNGQNQVMVDLVAATKDKNRWNACIQAARKVQRTKRAATAQVFAVVAGKEGRPSAQPSSPTADEGLTIPSQLPDFVWEDAPVKSAVVEAPPTPLATTQTWAAPASNPVAVGPARIAPANWGQAPAAAATLAAPAGPTPVVPTLATPAPPTAATPPTGLLDTLRSPADIGQRVGPVPVKQQVQFEIERPGFGVTQATFRYTDVIRSAGSLVLVYHKSYEGERYLPLELEQPLALHVQGTSQVFMVETTGILFEYADYMYCVLMIVKETQLDGHGPT